jgi:outer membrane protein TolC
MTRRLASISLVGLALALVPATALHAQAPGTDTGPGTGTGAGPGTGVGAGAGVGTGAGTAPGIAQPALGGTPVDEPPTRPLEIEGLAVQQGGLTADDTARRALAASSSVHQKRAELAAADARIRQTTIQFFPKLGLRASYTRLSEVDPPSFGGGGALVGATAPGPLSVGACPTGGGECVLDRAGERVGAAEFEFGIDYLEDNYALSANLTIPLSDYILRLSDAAASASASEEASRYAYEAERRKVQVDARVLYYNWLRAHAQVFIAQNALQRTRARLEDARSVFSVGRLANADVLRIEALVANAELTVQQAMALRALTGAQLAIVMDDEEGGEYAIGQGVPEVPTLPPVERAQAQRAIAAALQNRLELKAVDAAQRALRRGEEAMSAGAWPRLDAVGDVTYANPNPRIFPPANEWNATWSVGVVASLNLDEPFLSAARADELAAQAEATRGQRRGIEAAIVNEVVSSQLDLVKAQAALRASEVSVRAYEEAYRVATELFRVGRGTTTDLIDAESELLAAKLATTNARIDLVIAAVRLDYAIGAR